MRYVANPVEVEAHKIVKVDLAHPRPDGSIPLELENGLTVFATPEMCSRMTPVVGDYWVIQVADGYIYLNPKAVFERKYMPHSALGARG